MELIIALFLGVVQGLTEFLPVSSSGHLELAKAVFQSDFSADGSMLMTVVLHFATALSTIVVFRKDILLILKGIVTKTESKQKRYSIKIIISMIPAVFVGLIFDDVIEQFFNSQILLVGGMLLITGLLLILADRSKPSIVEVSYLNSLLIGLAQAIAILPGISRSGATIATSVILGVDKESAARFSFLMVIPLIFGKMIKDVLDGVILDENISFLSISIGFVAAFFTGILACSWMIKLVKNSQLKYFAIYCFVIAIITITWKIIC